jgi:hypothetical protein
MPISLSLGSIPLMLFTLAEFPTLSCNCPSELIEQQNLKKFLALAASNFQSHGLARES